MKISKLKGRKIELGVAMARVKIGTSPDPPTRTRGELGNVMFRFGAGMGLHLLTCVGFGSGSGFG